LLSGSPVVPAAIQYALPNIRDLADSRLLIPCTCLCH